MKVEATAEELLKRGGGGDADLNMAGPKYPMAFMQSSRLQSNLYNFLIDRLFKICALDWN